MTENNKGKNDNDENDNKVDKTNKRPTQSVPEDRKVIHKSKVLENGDDCKKRAECCRKQPVVLLVRKAFYFAMDAFRVGIKLLKTQYNIPWN